MASGLRDTLERIRNKSAVLLEKNDILKSEKESLEIQVNELQAEIAKLRKTNEDLKRSYEYLAMARTVVPSREEAERYRAIIDKLVRDIDKSISQLNE